MKLPRLQTQHSEYVFDCSEHPYPMWDLKSAIAYADTGGYNFVFFGGILYAKVRPDLESHSADPNRAPDIWVCTGLCKKHDSTTVCTDYVIVEV